MLTQVHIHKQTYFFTYSAIVIPGLATIMKSLLWLVHGWCTHTRSVTHFSKGFQPLEFHLEDDSARSWWKHKPQQLILQQGHFTSHRNSTAPITLQCLLWWPSPIHKHSAKSNSKLFDFNFKINSEESAFPKTPVREIQLYTSAKLGFPSEPSGLKSIHTSEGFFHSFICIFTINSRIIEKRFCFVWNVILNLCQAELLDIFDYVTIHSLCCCFSWLCGRI